MAALDTRIIAAEIQTNIAALKEDVDAVSTAVDAINTVAAAWVVNGDDSALPTALAVQAQLTAYDALNVSVDKPANSLNDSLAVIRAAE